MASSVKTFLIFVFLVIDIPYLSGENGDNQECSQAPDFKESAVRVEGPPKNEIDTNKKSDFVRRVQTNLQRTLSITHRAKFRKIKPEVHQKEYDGECLTDATKKAKSSSVVRANRQNERQDYLDTEKESKTEKSKLKPQMSMHETNQMKLENDFRIEISDDERRSFENIAPLLWKRMPTSGATKPEKGRSQSKDLTNKPLSKLRESLHSISDTLSKAKKIVKIPSSISKSLSKKSSQNESQKRGNSPQGGSVSGQFTSGHTRKPSFTYKPSAYGSRDVAYYGNTLSDRLVPSEHAEAIQRDSRPLPWLRQELQSASFKQPSHPSPQTSPDTRTQLLSYTSRKTEKLRPLEPQEDSSTIAQMKYPQQPPQTAQRMSRDFKQTESEGEERRRINEYINRHYSRVLSAGQMMEQGSPQQSVARPPTPQKPPSPEKPQRRNRGTPPSPPSSSSSSPEVPSTDPRIQLRRKLSNQEINEEYIARKNRHIVQP